MIYAVALVPEVILLRRSLAAVIVGIILTALFIILALLAGDKPGGPPRTRK